MIKDSCINDIVIYTSLKSNHMALGLFISDSAPNSPKGTWVNGIFKWTVFEACCSII